MWAATAILDALSSVTFSQRLYLCLMRSVLWHGWTTDTRKQSRMEEQRSYNSVSSGLLSCMASETVRGLSSARGHKSPLSRRSPAPGPAQRGNNERGLHAPGAAPSPSLTCTDHSPQSARSPWRGRRRSRTAWWSGAAWRPPQAPSPSASCWGTAGARPQRRAWLRDRKRHCVERPAKNPAETQRDPRGMEQGGKPARPRPLRVRSNPIPPSVRMASSRSSRVPRSLTEGPAPCGRRGSPIAPKRGRCVVGGRPVGRLGSVYSLQSPLGLPAGQRVLPQLPHPSLQRPQGDRSHRRDRASIVPPPPCGRRAMDRPPGAARRGPHGSWGAGGGAGAPFSPCPGSTCRGSPSGSSPACGAPRDAAAVLPRAGGRTPQAARRCRGTRLWLHGRRGRGWSGGRGRSRRPQRSRGACSRSCISQPGRQSTAGCAPRPANSRCRHTVTGSLGLGGTSGEHPV